MRPKIRRTRLVAAVTWRSRLLLFVYALAFIPFAMSTPAPGVTSIFPLALGRGQREASVASQPGDPAKRDVDCAESLAGPAAARAAGQPPRESSLGGESFSEVLYEGGQVLDALAAARPRRALGAEARAPSSSKVRNARRAACSRLERNLSWNYPPPAELGDERACLQEVLKDEDTVDPQPGLSVRPYCFEKLNVVKGEHSAVDLIPLLEGEARGFAEEPSLILKSEAELAGCADTVPLPYTDPILDSYPVFLRLVLELFRLRLV